MNEIARQEPGDETSSRAASLLAYRIWRMKPAGLFLSGPMSGIPDSNVPRFDQVATELRACGHAVINPVDVFRALFGAAYLAQPRHVYMDIACAVICRRETTGIVLLEHWTRSSGASAEAALAYALGRPLYEWPGLEMPLTPLARVHVAPYSHCRTTG